MKKYLSYILTGLSYILALSSCSSEIIQDTGYGYLGVNMDNDLELDVVTKATSDDTFELQVCNVSGTVVATTYGNSEEIAANPITLHVGSYSLYASCGRKVNAAFGAPFYEGRTARNFSITKDNTTSVNLVCKLANTKLSVEFPADFATHFTDYEVSVTNGVGEPLVFSNRPEAGNEFEGGFDLDAYFAVTGTLTWTLYLKNTDGGVYQASENITDVKARQYYRLVFSMGEEEDVDGAFAIRVNLQNKWDDNNHDLTLDFSTKNMPEVSVNEAFEVVSGTAYTVPVGDAEEKVMDFAAPEGIKTLTISHNNAVLEAAGLPKSVELAGASSELVANLGALGFNVTENQTRSISTNARNISVDLTGFVTSLPSGVYRMDFDMKDSRSRYVGFELVLEIIADIDVEAFAAYSGWASFVKIEGRIFNAEKVGKITFQYKKTADSEWVEIDPTLMDINTVALKYTTVVKGLAPSTEYVFRAVSDEDKETKEISFTTAAAPTIHNLNFDSWSNSDKFPNASGNSIWDSANSTGMVTTTTPVTDAVSGKAARLESVTTFGMLAAGNIFTGSFVGVAGLGAELDWGTPFTGRPLALKGYYKYAPKAIDYAQDPYSGMKDQTDQCQILICLTDWGGPFRVNTDDKKFVDFDNDPNIIAFAQFNTSEASSSYQEFVLPLVYRSNRTPKYVVIAGASSRYGDYFTGAKGSVLHIDEFELVYDPAKLTDEQYNKVFSKVSPF